MGLKIVKPKQRSKAGVRQPRGWRSVKGGAQKGKAGKAKEQWFNKGGRTGKASGGRIGKQFGGGLSRPLGGMRAPVGAMGPQRLGIKKGGKA